MLILLMVLAAWNLVVLLLMWRACNVWWVNLCARHNKLIGRIDELDTKLTAVGKSVSYVAPSQIVGAFAKYLDAKRKDQLAVYPPGDVVVEHTGPVDRAPDPTPKHGEFKRSKDARARI